MKVDHYQLLEEYLPIKGYIINCYEVDTPNDLKHAKKWAKKYLRS